jgi:tetratricopeptide (TPR) repeat protein
MHIRSKYLENVSILKSIVAPSFRFAYCLASLVLFAAPGCRSLDLDLLDFEPALASREVSPLAVRHNNKALKYHEHGKLAKAETHFLKAIDYDPAFAAAHNNLGNLQFARRDLYQAAWEFERAAELAPTSIEPLINLGLIHDEADRLDDAADYYERALEIAPQNPVALGNLARVRVKQDYDPTEIHSMLREVVFLDTRPEWVEWAQELLATRYRPDYGVGLQSESGRSSTGPALDNNRNMGTGMAPQSIPLIIEQVPATPEQFSPQSLPTPQKPAPIITPTLMDIPSPQNIPTNQFQQSSVTPQVVKIQSDTPHGGNGASSGMGVGR